jgi:predicted DNA-binding ribbon-helix-helix protein
MNLEDNIWSKLSDMAEQRNCSVRHVIESILVAVLKIKGHPNTRYFELTLTTEHKEKQNVKESR